jgi:hypothetical protein
MILVSIELMVLIVFSAVLMVGVGLACRGTGVDGVGGAASMMIMVSMVLIVRCLFWKCCIHT